MKNPIVEVVFIALLFLMAFAVPSISVDIYKISVAINRIAANQCNGSGK